MRTILARLFLCCIAAWCCRAGADDAPARTAATRLLEQKADQASLDGNYREAAELYEKVMELEPINVQDDTRALRSAATAYANLGDYEKAIALWERLLTIPAAPGAQRPSPWSKAVDYRGEAYWGMADARRKQGRWAVALAQYQTAFAKDPPDDGCVHSGRAFQEAAMAEGSCLEQLGRFDEAAQLYWKAAIQLDISVPPLAMRRLVDLYSAAGKLPALTAAIEQERKPYDHKIKWMYGYTQDEVQYELDKSPMAEFDRICRTRQAAHEKQWSKLLPESPSSNWGSPVQKYREQLAALAANAKESLPVLELVLERDPMNPYLQAGVLACSVPKQRRDWLAHHRGYASWIILCDALGGAIGYDEMWQFPTHPKILNLPMNLPDNKTIAHSRNPSN